MYANSKETQWLIPESDKLFVLLAEEHRLTAKIEKKGLEEGGFKVNIVDSTEEIFNNVKNYSINFIILSLEFNKEKGIEFIKDLRRISLNKNIKIILTSVIPVKNKLNPNIQKNIDHFIVKPIQQSKMIEELKKLIRKDTRQFERVKLKLEASLLINEQIHSINVIDISDSGIHIKKKSLILKLKIDEELNIHINLPIYKNPIQFTGKIARVTKEGFGIKILNITEANKNKIRKFIESYNYNKHNETYYL